MIAIASATGDSGSCYKSAGDIGSQDAAGGITSKFSKNGHPGRWKLGNWPWAAGTDRGDC